MAIHAAGGITGSATSTGSFGNIDITGDAIIHGTLTAREMAISSSVTNVTTLAISGSSKFGDSGDDIHQFTGSLNVTGSNKFSHHVGIGTDKTNSDQYTVLHLDANGADNNLLVKQMLSINGTLQGSLFGFQNAIGFLDGDNNYAYRHITDSIHEWRTNNVTKMILKDGGGDMNERLGIGVDDPHGTLHVNSNDLSGASYNASADNLIVEHDNDAGISILTPNNKIGAIYFGDPQDDNIGMLQYNHSTNKMLFTAAASANPLFSLSGNTAEFGSDIAKISGSATSTGSFGRVSVATAKNGVNIGAIPSNWTSELNILGTQSTTGIKIQAPSSGNAQIKFYSNNGGSNNDFWYIQATNGGTFDIVNYGPGSFTNMVSITANTGNMTVRGNVSGSVTSTGSFGKLLGDGSDLSGISGFPFTGSAGISGSLLIDRQAANSGSTVFDVNGSQGNLFSLVDNFNGELFSVRSKQGAPFFVINSDNTSHIGPLGDPIRFSKNSSNHSEITSSANFSASFGRLNVASKILVGGSDLNDIFVNEGDIVGFPFTGSIAGISGSLAITRDAPNSGSSVFTIDASQGRLFEIIDDNTDNFFKVTNGAGVPLFKVRSDNDIEFPSINQKISGSITSTGSFGDLKIGAVASGQLYSSFSSSIASRVASAAAGGISFNGSTANGLVTYGGATTADVESTLIYSGSRLGIGETSPDAKLHIKGGAFNTSLVIQGGGSDTGIQFKGSDDEIDGYVYALSKEIAFLDADGSYAIRHITDSKTEFRINNNIQATLTTTGLGIGNTSPSNKLDVTGTGRFTSNLTVGGNISGSSTSTGSFGHLQIQPDTDTGFAKIGRTFIGTTHSDHAGFSHVDQALSSGGYALVQYTTGITALNAASGASIRLNINNSEVGRVTSTGVGIGTTTPNRPLHVYQGTVNDKIAVFQTAASGNTQGITIGSGTNGNNGQGLHIGYGQATDLGYFDAYDWSAGAYQKLGINNFVFINAQAGMGIGQAAPAYKLDVTGDGRFTTNLTVGGNINATNIIATGDITAQRLIVSSSVTNMVVAEKSGSTIFGDSSDDIHQFTGSLRLRTGASGVGFTDRTDGDDLIVENSNHGGISILTPDNKFSTINFGSPSDNRGAVLDYSHSTKVLNIGTDIASGKVVFKSAAGSINMTLDASGNLGIGKTPTEKLDISGNIMANHISTNANGTGSFAMVRVTTGNISGSATSTGSFGKLLGDGSSLTNLPSSPAFPFTGSAGLSGSIAVKDLTAATGSTMLSVQGSEGTLFSVVNSMTGSIFSANTVAGIPVIEAFSNGDVHIGPSGSSFAKLYYNGYLQSSGSGGGGGSGTGFPFTGSAGLSGSLEVKHLGAATGSTLLSVNGSEGTLFSVVNSMTGSIFSANTTAGIPVIEAFSDGDVTFGPLTSKISGSSISTGSFGKLFVGGSEITSSPNATDGSQNTISGSAVSTGSFGRVHIGAPDSDNNIGMSVGSTVGSHVVLSIYASTANKQPSLQWKRSDGEKYYIQHEASGLNHKYTNGDGNYPSYMYVDNSQNIGMGGQTSPAHKLDVTGTGRFTGTLTTAAITTTGITSTGNVSGSSTSTVSAGDYRSLNNTIFVDGSAKSFGIGKAAYGSVGTAGAWFSDLAGSGGFAQIAVNGSNAALWLSNVGSGELIKGYDNTTLTFTLDQDGSITTTGNISGSSTSTGSFGGVYSAGVSRFNGNVGIGTTSTGDPLRVRVGSNQNLGFNSSGGVFRLSAYNDAVSANVPLLINASLLRFANNNSEIVRITGAKVGIGNTTPSEKLDVTGNIKASGNITAGNITATGDIIAQRYIVSSSVSVITSSFSSGSTIFGDTLKDTHQFTGSLNVKYSGSVGDNTAFSIEGNTGNLLEITDSQTGSLFNVNDVSGVPIFDVNSNDTITMGQFSSPIRVLTDSNGNTMISGSATSTAKFGQFTEASSIAFKTNVETLQNPLDKISQLRGVTYNLKANNEPSIGMIAEEVNKVFPELVDKDNDGNPQAMSYTRMTAVLLEAVKELTEEVKELKKANIYNKYKDKE